MMHPIDSEYRVVYFLCQLRKLKNAINDFPIPPTLKLYCDWVLHTELKGTKTISPVMRRIDNIVAARLANNLHEEALLVLDIFHLHVLRREIYEFLEKLGISADLCVQEYKWNGFAMTLRAIIEDCPLNYSSADDLTYVNQLTLKKTESGIDLIILLKTGEEHQISISEDSLMGGIIWNANKIILPTY